MFATVTHLSTSTNWTAPNLKLSPLLHFRYSASGDFHLLDSANTKPLPQPPRSLQTCAMILWPDAWGQVASPWMYRIMEKLPMTCVDADATLIIHTTGL